ncbi:hypothetical protein GTZ99_03110 [Novosphingobium sp. FSY-8]|uniref:Lipoprotein n=1 Tax=Novosphingobium ovatum TaxID=1908523 RepID=A0ABW9XAH6_9SPHN|nr:hypothetical protein [Novosphingobium ovatum]NBC35541.1 hypothetical protein [Novosphingobium ovatum]
MRYIASMVALGALLILGLGGCAPAIQPPRSVSVPIATPCVDSAQIPAEPARAGPALTGEARHDASILAASNLRLRAAFREARALLVGCVAGE